MFCLRTLREQPGEMAASMTNFVFGMLIGLFIVVALVVAGLVVLDDLLSEAGVLNPPLA